MDVALALTAAQTLFATLQCAEVRKLCSIYKYESELLKLLDTVKTIKTFLMDADSKCQDLSNEGQNWVENLKNAVYDADDLLDEFNTIAHKPGTKISKKVRRFFSPKNQLLFAVNMSREIKKLSVKLDSLAENHSNFGFSELYKPAKIKKETCSYVYEESIIGRDDDKEAIVDLLLKDDSEMNISFVTIVGIGGLGKTTLAQLVFNDLRIKEAFQGNRYWVCVSVNFDTKYILGKMLGVNEELGFEGLHKKFREQIEGNKFLLVLDDVWSENGREWDELRNFLNIGGKGSRILVTSRSQRVARAIGNGNYPMYELKGLSEEESWELFKEVSLGQRGDKVVTSLVEIGKDIVRKCANVPLSIRVIASLLRNQDISTWQSLKRIDLANMYDGADGVDGIMTTLMFSYYHLSPELKCCFSFCSVFPEDYRIEKEKLIRLWMAQGYLVPSSKTENMEDVGERYFSVLLHRCFFQDVRHNKSGEVESVQMHDLIHDLARKVAGKETLTSTASSSHEVEGKVRHMFIDDVYNKHLTNWLSSSNIPSKTLRTFLNVGYCVPLAEVNILNNGCVFPTSVLDFFNYGIYGYNIPMSLVDAIFTKCSRLRVLDLHKSFRSRNIPDTLGKLLHLRYIDLSLNFHLEMLPESITNLYNLETLKLCGCSNLKELPKDTSRLVNLRVLDIANCESLTYMPPGMGRLTYLNTLPMFIVGGDDDELKQDKKEKPIDLKALINNLRGKLNVIQLDCMRSRDRMVVQLESLQLKCKFEALNVGGQESVLECLFFNHQFCELYMRDYGGTKLPSLASGLVSIHLTCCNELQYLPSSLSQLCHLKDLKLVGLKNLEYIEGDAPSPSLKFFPSLEKLNLSYMPKVKGWWRDVRWMDKETVFIPSFPHLRELNIQECKGFTYFPQCPHVKELILCRVNEALKFCKKGDGGVESNPITLESLYILNSCVPNSVFKEFAGSVVLLHLCAVENLGTIREEFQGCASSVEKLKLETCRGLENLGMEQFTNLKSLSLRFMNLIDIPWKSLHSLSSFEIYFCRGVVILPKGIQYMTSLQSLILDCCPELEDLGECITSLKSLQLLEIRDCRKLKSLPEAVGQLTSLTTLKLIDPSPELRERCLNSDWNNICHISSTYTQ